MIWRLDNIARVLAGFAALLGLAGFSSYFVPEPTLRSFGVGATGMSALTGLALIIAAASVLGAVARRNVTLGGALLVLVGAVVLGEWALNVQTSVAHLLIPRSARTPLGSRVPVPASIMFIMLGVALITLRRGRGPMRRPADHLAIVTWFAALSVLTAYAYGASSFGSVLSAPTTGIALPTGFALLSLSTAILLIDARDGIASVVLADSPGGYLARRIIVIEAFGPPALGVLVTAGRDVGLRNVLGQLAVLTVMTSGVAIGAVVVATRGVNESWARRQRAEELLRVSEARFRELFEHSVDGVFLADTSGRYVDVNEAGCRILRTTRDQIVGKSIADFLRAEDLGRLAAEREKVLAGRRLVGEWSMRRGDGTFGDLEVSTRLLPDGRWVGLARDISDRKAAERLLDRAHAAERSLRGQIEAVSNATAAVSAAVAQLPQSDLYAVLQSVVLQAKAVTGARYGALGIGTDPERPFDPWVTVGMEDVARVVGRNPRPRGLLGAVALTGKPARIDDITKDDRFVAFPPGHPPMRSLIGVPIRYQDKPIGNLYLADKADGSPFSVDDQRLLEILVDRIGIALEIARLYEGEARERSWLQITIDQIPEPVVLADSEGRVTSFNRAASHFAHESGDRPGGPFELRTPNGEPLAWEDHPLRRACTRGEPVSGLELQAIDRLGRAIPVLASASPLRLHEPGVHGAVAVLQDISHHKDIARLREEWTAIVAHDLRQPIGAISLAAELLERRGLAEQEAKLVARIRSGAERVHHMVDDLLDYAQIEAGRLRIVPRPVNLEPLVVEVVDRIAPANRHHPLRLVVENHDTRAAVDPARIDQVVTNLVSNATKYGYEGSEVVVTIAGHGEEVEISVTNRGPGLNNDELAQLFGRFERTARARESRVRGVGLGLHIARGIVEAHGGRIWAESTPGATTTFHVALPVVPRAA